MDLEHCDPEIFEALVDILAARGREQVRDQLAEELKARMGR